MRGELGRARAERGPVETETAALLFLKPEHTGTAAEHAYNARASAVALCVCSGVAARSRSAAAGQLRCCSLPLPFLVTPPSERHRPLLARAGCAAAPSLVGDLKALKALADGLSVPGAAARLGAAASRASSHATYAERAYG